MVDDSNVVNQGQQRFVPGEQRDVSISVLFFQATFSVRDTLFGFPLGSAIRLRFPDGHVRRYPLANRATLRAAGAGTRPVRGERRRRRPLVHATGIPLARSESCTECDQLPRCRPAGRRDQRDPPRSAPRSPASASATIRDRLQHVREQLRRAGQGATGLPIFRVAGVAAILVLVLVFLVGLFSGTDGGDSSSESPRSRSLRQPLR